MYVKRILKKYTGGKWFEFGIRFVRTMHIFVFD